MPKQQIEFSVEGALALSLTHFDDTFDPFFCKTISGSIGPASVFTHESWKIWLADWPHALGSCKKPWRLSTVNPTEGMPSEREYAVRPTQKGGGDPRGRKRGTEGTPW